MIRSTLLCTVVLAHTFTTDAVAELRLPAVFGDHMVLQHDAVVPVWGWADPGESVTVTMQQQSRSATADADGRWSVTLHDLATGAPTTLKVKTATDTVTCNDVLIGEVWICSGQSNMFWPIDESLDPDLERAAANHPDIRLFQVPISSSAEPQDDVDAAWKRCSPESVSKFSAVAYFYGRMLHDVLNVPVGLIHTSVGGTPAEAWTPRPVLAKNELFRTMLDEWQKKADDWDPVTEQERLDKAIAQWEIQAEKARAAGKPVTYKPFSLGDPGSSILTPGALYNAMVAPLAPYAVKGAIWYQGESNVTRAHEYRTLMPTMIQAWRDTWKQTDLPFYMVQLANFHDVTNEPGDSDWAELREAQMLTTTQLPDVGVACITDLGEATDIHPKNKQDVSKRLARLALCDVYGFSDRMTRNGPVYQSVMFADGRATVTFDAGGLDLSSWYKDRLHGFAIAGADRKWFNADCEITGPNAVHVWSDAVPEPVAVRYNWAQNPQGNLYNAALLPAYPFRTDDWPGVTQPKE